MGSGISWNSWWGPLSFLVSLTIVSSAKCPWIQWIPFTSMGRHSCRSGLDQTSPCPWVWRAQLGAPFLHRWFLKNWMFFTPFSPGGCSETASVLWSSAEWQRDSLWDSLSSKFPDLPSSATSLSQPVRMITPALFLLVLSLYAGWWKGMLTISSSAKRIIANFCLFRCRLLDWNLFFIFFFLVMGLCVFPQCPSTRVATAEDDCDCVVGPPGQRGLPGRMVAHTNVELSLH